MLQIWISVCNTRRKSLPSLENLSKINNDSFKNLHTQKQYACRVLFLCLLCTYALRYNFITFKYHLSVFFLKISILLQGSSINRNIETQTKYFIHPEYRYIGNLGKLSAKTILLKVSFRSLQNRYRYSRYVVLLSQAHIPVLFQMGLKIAVILSLHFRHAAMSGMIINILSLPEKSKEEKNKYTEKKIIFQ